MGLWLPRGQADAHKLPRGMAVSTDLEKIRLNKLITDPKYRAKIVLASKMAGYTDKGLILTSKAAQLEGEDSLFRQNAKAEQLLKIKGNTDEKKIILAGRN